MFNGLLILIIEAVRVDRGATLGYGELVETARRWPPARVEEVWAFVAAVGGAIKFEASWAGGRMPLVNDLGVADRSEKHLAESFRAVSEHHAAEPDVFQMTRLLASWSDENRAALAPLAGRYEEKR